MYYVYITAEAIVQPIDSIRNTVEKVHVLVASSSSEHVASRIYSRRIEHGMAAEVVNRPYPPLPQHIKSLRMCELFEECRA